MLVALADDQSYIALTGALPRTALQKLREAKTFFCPQCKEPLILKIGQVNVPHFAHRKNSSCESFFTEGESKTHLLGKQQLFSLFQQLQLNVKLEPYLMELQQRPDLLVTKNNAQYAIEFQCSRLATERFNERTTGYKAHAISPIWLLSTPSEKYKKQGLIKISINHFQRLFLQHKQLPFLMTYDVDDKTFYYISNLFHFQGQQYFGFGQAIPLSQQVFPFYVPQHVSFENFQTLIAHYKQENAQYLHAHLMFSRAGVKDHLLRAMYELKLSRDTIPPFIGIAIKGQELVSKPAIEWQILLFFFVHIHLFTFDCMTSQKIFYFLEWANLSVVEAERIVVARYIQLLVHFDIETAQSEINEHTFMRYVYNELVAIE